MAAVASIPLIAHLRKKGLKQNDNAEINFIDDLNLRESAIFKNIKTLKNVNTPLNSLIENSGSPVTNENRAVINTQRGDVEPYVTLPVKENPSPLRKPSIKPICIYVSSPRKSGYHNNERIIGRMQRINTSTLFIITEINFWSIGFLFIG